MFETVRWLLVRPVSDDLDISTFITHKIIIIIKKTCLGINVVCVVGYQGRHIACDISFFLTSF